jgi:glutamate--cysteine ligase
MNSGYKVIIASFLKDHPSVCNDSGFLRLSTAQNNEVEIFCLNYILKYPQEFNFDICILNNDLSDGHYHELLELNIPIIPHPNFGWHQRKKSTHFETLNTIIQSMINECNLKIDSWQLTTLFTTVENININNESDRQIISDKAGILLNEIKQKYEQYNINETPYLVLKSNNGTYGMGVISIESAEDILTLNRKKRNKLATGKSSMPIQSLIIQEGIPSINIVNESSAEEVIYNVNGSSISGFYRFHEKKSNKDILNATGMQFNSFKSDLSKQSYILAQLANLSAQQELANL